MVSNIMMRSTSIFTAPIFTRLLTTSDYGIASNFIAWLNILKVFVGIGLPYSIGIAKIDYPFEFDEYIASIQTLGSMVCVLLFTLAIIFRDLLSAWMELDRILVIFMFIYLMFSMSVVYTQEKYKFSFRYKENIYISLFNTLGTIVFSIALILIFNKQRYLGRIIGLLLPLLLMGVIFYFKILYSGWCKKFNKYWAYALKISIPMIPHSFAMVVLGQVDRIMIIKISGSSDAGLYSFGYMYAVLLSIISNAVMQAYKPWLYEKYRQGDYKSIRSSSNVITLGMCILTLFIITVAPEALKILGSRPYWDAKYVVMPIAIGTLCQYVYSLYSGLELYHKKTTVIAIGSVSAAALNYILNSTFIPSFGYVAAAYTTFASYLALAVFHRFAYKKVCKKYVYDDKYIWTFVMITAILSILIKYLYEFMLIRYVVFLAILLVIVFSQKKKIKMLLKVDSFEPFNLN